MHEPLFPDLYDWRGCSVVEFDPEKLAGCANVLGTRMFADGVLINFKGGMTPEAGVGASGFFDCVHRKGAMDVAQDDAAR